MVKTKNFPAKAVSERVLLVTIDLYADGAGVTDPSLVEIAAADARANGSLNALPDVRRVEANVRADIALLLNATGHQQFFVVPLSQRYYDEYRGMALGVEDARRCIAGRGRGASTEGFAFIEGADHPLLLAYLETLSGRVRGGIEALGDRVVKTIDAGRLTTGAAGTVIPSNVGKTRAVAAKTAKALRDQNP